MSLKPKLIQHYASRPALLGICDAGAIWGTDILYLSDASEFNYAADLALAVLERYPSDFKEALRLAVADILAGRSLGPDRTVYIASFSEHEGQVLICL